MLLHYTDLSTVGNTDYCFHAEQDSESAHSNLPLPSGQKHFLSFLYHISTFYVPQIKEQHLWITLKSKRWCNSLVLFSVLYVSIYGVPCVFLVSESLWVKSRNQNTGTPIYWHHDINTLPFYHTPCTVCATTAPIWSVHGSLAQWHNLPQS